MSCMNGSVYSICIPVVFWRPLLPALRPILVRVADPAAHDVVVAGHHGETLGDGEAVVAVGLGALADRAWEGRKGVYMLGMYAVREVCKLYGIVYVYHWR